jgi:hypothetical protein
VGGEALVRATNKVVDKAKKVVAHMLEAAPEDIELQDGKFAVKGSPDKGMTLAEVAGAAFIPGEGWPPATRHWWEVVRAMPHAVLWTAGDWEFAQMTAEVHARTAEGWKGYVGSELRQREKLLGLYADARRDLRIRYIPAKPAVAASETPAGVARLDDYRDL